MSILGSKRNSEKFKVYLSNSSSKGSKVEKLENDTLELHLSSHNVSLELKDFYNKDSNINFSDY